MKKFARYVKIVGVIALFFFMWTYLPLYQLAAYAAIQENRVKKQSQEAEKQNAADKLEKLLDDLREKMSKTEEKAAKGADTLSEVESIKAHKTEIDAIDFDLIKDFAATEKKLRDANLPKEILNRHSAFVKNYENNLSELRANIDAIEKAKTPAVLKAEITKARTHLEKVKPPRKHVPLDPNKLPNRIVKAKERQPKLNKEEWEKELKKDIKETKTAQKNRKKPIILASNGPFTGQLSGTDSISVSTPSESYPQLADLSTDGLLQTAQTVTYKYPPPPELYPLPYKTDMKPEDKIETPETHVTNAIRAKAVELQNDPILMFNWLRNNIYLVPSYGSIQGADMCLQTKQCNATDIASLTIAMFRAADWPARYEFQTVELDIDRFMENMGNFTDPQAAITFAASGGIPVRPVMSGGKITAVQFEHVYATALLPMGFYIGAVMKRGWSQPMWMPLDVSLKHYVTTPGIDIGTTVPFDTQGFVNQIQSTATINQTEGYVTNVNSALIQQTMQDYQTRVQDYISQNTPTATVGDVLGKREIKKQNLPHLSPTGWTKPVTARVQSHTLPDSMKSSISFNIPDPSDVNNGLFYTTSLPEMAGKKITLSFSPATATDQAVVASYTSTSNSISSLPAYLVNVVPELKIDGQLVSTGAPITLGKELSFTISLNEPGIGLSQIDNVILAGEYYGIGLDTGRITAEYLNALNMKLGTTKTKLGNHDHDGLTKDTLIGDFLYTTAAAYFAELDATDEITAKTMNVVHYRAPSIGMFSLKLDVRGLFNVPTGVNLKGMMMDADRVMQAVISKDGNMDQIRKYMFKSGITSSALEHAIPEQIFSTADSPVEGISAIKAIQVASGQGIPIYTVTNINAGTVLPQLSISSEAKDDVINAVYAGKTVITQKSNITYNGWNGCGYIVLNPDTGAAAYMISGGMNGSYTPTYWSGLDTVMLMSDSTGYGLNAVTEASMEREINVMYRGFAYIGVLVSFAMDIHHAFTDPNLTTAQRTATISLAIGTAIFAGLAVYLSAGLLGIVLSLFITILLNIIKVIIMQSIINSQRERKIRFA